MPAVIYRVAYGDPSLGALERAKVNDKLFSLSLPLSLLLSSLSPYPSIFLSVSRLPTSIRSF